MVWYRSMSSGVESRCVECRRPFSDTCTPEAQSTRTQRSGGIAHKPEEHQSIDAAGNVLQRGGHHLPKQAEVCHSSLTAFILESVMQFHRAITMPEFCDSKSSCRYQKVEVVLVSITRRTPSSLVLHEKVKELSPESCLSPWREPAMSLILRGWYNNRLHSAYH